MPIRPRFDPNRPLVAARAFLFLGVQYKPGDPFDPEGATPRQRAAQYEARAVNFAPETAEGPGNGPDGQAPAGDQPNAPASPPAPAGQTDHSALVEMRHAGGGVYLITAPWLDQAQRVRGKIAAEAERDQIREAGPPEGWSPADS